MNFDDQTLKNWFSQEKRDLPWRSRPSPYAVWVSEVMLQQTQVAVVIPYFERWMQRFPTVTDLAAADSDAIIKMWEGLGYYSRARNLHEGAKTIVEKHKGIIPDTKEELQKIKGLGPYTIGAILSFAFHKKEPAVDGNVIRVLSRHFTITEDIAKPATVKEIRKLASDILPDEEPWIVSEALIELGATLCSRKPQCKICPLQNSCLAHRHGIAETLPVKSPRTKTINLTRLVAIIKHQDDFLIQRGEAGKVMHDLHEFPYLEIDPDKLESVNLSQQIKENWGFEGTVHRKLPATTQTFTKYRVKLHPYVFEAEKKKKMPGFCWVPKYALQKLAFSSGHKRILNSLLN